MVLDGPCTTTLNPTVNATYDFLEQFLLEVSTIFPEEYLFLGGDEVSGNCWSGSPTVQAWMTQHKMDATQLGRYFWQQMTSRVFPKLNRVRASCCHAASTNAILSIISWTHETLLPDGIRQLAYGKIISHSHILRTSRRVLLAMCGYH